MAASTCVHLGVDDLHIFGQAIPTFVRLVIAYVAYSFSHTHLAVEFDGQAEQYVVLIAAYNGNDQQH